MTQNEYPWNEVHHWTISNPVAAVLHHGFNAVCEHLARIEDAIRERPSDEEA